MARKTNKTDHVLNLLVGTDTGSDKEEKKTEEKNSGEKRSQKKPGQETVPDSQSPETDKGSVHVVLSSIREGDPVAGIIKEKLEEEFEKEEAARAAEGAAMTQPAEPFREPQEPAPSRGTGEPALSGEPEESALPQEPGEPAQSQEPDGKPEPEEMEGYVFYNIMEKIVKDKAMKYMKQFGNCTCKRCEADTIALSLSKLPPKYVVVRKDSVSPLVNFYEDHFAGQIIVEITKACIVVNKNPRHQGK